MRPCRQPSQMPARCKTPRGVVHRDPFDALWDASLDEISGRGSHMKCRGTCSCTTQEGSTGQRPRVSVGIELPHRVARARPRVTFSERGACAGADRGPSPLSAALLAADAAMLAYSCFRIARGRAPLGERLSFYALTRRLPRLLDWLRRPWDTLVTRLWLRKVSDLTQADAVLVGLQRPWPADAYRGSRGEAHDAHPAAEEEVIDETRHDRTRQDGP